MIEYRVCECRNVRVQDSISAEIEQQVAIRLYNAESARRVSKDRTQQWWVLFQCQAFQKPLVAGYAFALASHLEYSLACHIPASWARLHACNCHSWVSESSKPTHSKVDAYVHHACNIYRKYRQLVIYSNAG